MQVAALCEHYDLDPEICHATDFGSWTEVTTCKKRASDTRKRKYALLRESGGGRSADGEQHGAVGSNERKTGISGYGSGFGSAFGAGAASSRPQLTRKDMRDAEDEEQLRTTREEQMLRDQMEDQKQQRQHRISTSSSQQQSEQLQCASHTDDGAAAVGSQAAPRAVLGVDDFEREDLAYERRMKRFLPSAHMKQRSEQDDEDAAALERREEGLERCTHQEQEYVSGVTSGQFDNNMGTNGAQGGRKGSGGGSGARSASATVRRPAHAELVGRVRVGTLLDSMPLSKELKKRQRRRRAERQKKQQQRKQQQRKHMGGRSSLSDQADTRAGAGAGAGMEGVPNDGEDTAADDAVDDDDDDERSLIDELDAEYSSSDTDMPQQEEAPTASCPLSGSSDSMFKSNLAGNTHKEPNAQGKASAQHGTGTVRVDQQETLEQAISMKPGGDVSDGGGGIHGDVGEDSEPSGLCDTPPASSPAQPCSEQSERSEGSGGAWRRLRKHAQSSPRSESKDALLHSQDGGDQSNGAIAQSHDDSDDEIIDWANKVPSLSASQGRSFESNPPPAAAAAAAGAATAKQPIIIDLVSSDDDDDGGDGGGGGDDDDDDGGGGFSNEQGEGEIKGYSHSKGDAGSPQNEAVSSSHSAAAGDDPMESQLQRPTFAPKLSAAAQRPAKPQPNPAIEREELRAAGIGFGATAAATTAATTVRSEIGSPNFSSKFTQSSDRKSDSKSTGKSKHSFRADAAGSSGKQQELSGYFQRIGSQSSSKSFRGMGVKDGDDCIEDDDEDGDDCDAAAASTTEGHTAGGASASTSKRKKRRTLELQKKGGSSNLRSSGVAFSKKDYVDSGDELCDVIHKLDGNSNLLLVDSSGDSSSDSDFAPGQKGRKSKQSQRAKSHSSRNGIRDRWNDGHQGAAGTEMGVGIGAAAVGRPMRLSKETQQVLEAERRQRRERLQFTHFDEHDGKSTFAILFFDFT